MILILILVAIAALIIWFLFFYNRGWSVSIQNAVNSMKVGDLEQASVHLSNARIALGSVQKNDPRRLILELEQARAIALEKEYNLSASIIQQVIELSDPNNKLYINIYARAILNLAEVMAMAGNSDDAEHLVKNAVKYREQRFGTESREVAIVLNRYADFLADQIRMDEAESVFRRAKRIIEG